MENGSRNTQRMVGGINLSLFESESASEFVQVNCKSRTKCMRKTKTWGKLYLTAHPGWLFLFFFKKKRSMTGGAMPSWVHCIKSWSY